VHCLDGARLDALRGRAQLVARGLVERARVEVEVDRIEGARAALLGQLRRLALRISKMDLGLAWTSIAAWSGLALVVLLAKVRRVEVVS